MVCFGVQPVGLRGPEDGFCLRFFLLLGYVLRLYSSRAAGPEGAPMIVASICHAGRHCNVNVRSVFGCVTTASSGMIVFPKISLQFGSRSVLV